MWVQAAATSDFEFWLVGSPLLGLGTAMVYLSLIDEVPMQKVLVQVVAVANAALFLLPGAGWAQAPTDANATVRT
jgi:hypothetical protein